jgi:anti-sigma-K factor RskA
MTKNDDADLSGAYALNSLSDDEREAYEAVLKKSDAARVEATELADTAVMLGLAVEPVPPSPALRASVLSAIAETPQLAPATPATPARPVGQAERTAQQRWFSRPVRAVVGVAAAVALIAGGVAIGATLPGAQQAPPTASAIQQLQSADDVQRASATITSGGTASLMWSGSLGKAAISVSGEPAPPAGSVYQLWFIADGNIRSAGLLPADYTDEQWQVLTGTMKAGDSVGVTVEPDGGSAQPTTSPIVVLASA